VTFFTVAITIHINSSTAIRGPTKRRVIGVVTHQHIMLSGSSLV
jgi:hypothetical protein